LYVLAIVMNAPSISLRAPLIIAGLLSTGGLQAAVTAGTSSAIGVDASTEVLSVIAVTPVQIGSSSGSAPAVYNTSQSAVSANANVSVPVVITALATQGLLATNVQSNVDGTAGSKSASATATLTGPEEEGPFSVTVADVFSVINDPPALLAITATTIQTTSTVSGDTGALISSGTTILANFTLSINGGTGLTLAGLGLTAGVDFDAGTGEILLPNRVINLSLLDGSLSGVSLILNRQVETVNTADQRDLEVTAIALDLDGITVAGLPGVSLDLDLAKSTSELVAAPEPEIASLIIGSFGILALRRRRF
jgi:hypothetical protein